MPSRAVTHGFIPGYMREHPDSPAYSDRSRSSNNGPGLDNPQETRLVRGSSETIRQASELEKELAVAMELSPDWVVGFVDGEGCFFVGIQRNPTATIGMQVIPEFRVVQHNRDLDVLHALKRFFGFGRVCRNHGERWEYRVRRIEHLREIARFFEQHRLRTKKRVDALKFSDVLRMMDERRHLTVDGLRDIAKLAASMNTGDRPRLSELLDSDEDRVQSDVKASE